MKTPHDLLESAQPILVLSLHHANTLLLHSCGTSLHTAACQASHSQHGGNPEAMPGTKLEVPVDWNRTRCRMDGTQPDYHLGMHVFFAKMVMLPDCLVAD